MTSTETPITSRILGSEFLHPQKIKKPAQVWPLPEEKPALPDGVYAGSDIARNALGLFLFTAVSFLKILWMHYFLIPAFQKTYAICVQKGWSAV